RLRGNAYPIPKNLIDFGNLRRMWPVSDASPDRGLPVSAYYIEHFLSCRNSDVKGCVIEFPTDKYTHQLGAGRVTRVEVGDLLEESSTDAFPSHSFDCAIVVQELACVADVPAALK